MGRAEVFRYLDVPTIIQALKFPPHILGLALNIHRGTRMLKAAGTMIEETGRSIRAGCTNSTSFARAYMKDIVASVEECDGHMIFEHVDDMAQLFFHKGEIPVERMTIAKIKKLGEVIVDGRLIVPDKSVCVTNPTALATRNSEAHVERAAPNDGRTSG